MSKLPAPHRLELPKLVAAVPTTPTRNMKNLRRFSIPFLICGAILCFVIGSFLPDRSENSKRVERDTATTSPQVVQTSTAPILEIRQAIVIEDAIPVETLDSPEIVLPAELSVIEIVGIEE